MNNKNRMRLWRGQVAIEDMGDWLVGTKRALRWVAAVVYFAILMGVVAVVYRKCVV